MRSCNLWNTNSSDKQPTMNVKPSNKRWLFVLCDCQNSNKNPSNYLLNLTKYKEQDNFSFHETQTRRASIGKNEIENVNFC